MRGASNKSPSRYICWNMDVLVVKRSDPESNEARFQSFTPLLDNLNSRGCANLIVTTRPRADAETAMRVFEMEPHFSALFAKEDIAPLSLVRYMGMLSTLNLDAYSASNRMMAVCRGMEDVPLDLDIVSLIYPNLPAPALVGEMLSLMLQNGQSLVEAHASLQRVAERRLIEGGSIRGRSQLQCGATMDAGLVQNPFSPLQWNRILAIAGP